MFLPSPVRSSGSGFGNGSRSRAACPAHRSDHPGIPIDGRISITTPATSASTEPNPVARPRNSRGLPAATWIALVVVAGLLSALTAPGQTAGLSVFTDPIIDGLGIPRAELSIAYLIGTLLGAAAQPLIGRLLDRVRAITALISIVVSFSAILLAVSFVANWLDIAVAYTGLRMAGQGALSLATTTVLARAVSHRRGLALGIASAIGTAGISLAPVGLEALISSVGIEAAWRWEALIVLVLGVPCAWVLGRRPTSASTWEEPSAPQGDGLTQREALRTGMFWVLAAATSTSGLITTALAFHQIAILGERGLTPVAAAANFIPQTITGLVATLAVGALIDRTNPRWWIVGSMTSLVLALGLLTVIGPGATALVFGLVLGAAGGLLRGMEAATAVRYFGVRHIGSIRGVLVSINLASTAVGPIAFAVLRDATGSFQAPAVMLAVIPVAVITVTLLMPSTNVTGDAASPAGRPPSQAGAADRNGAPRRER